MTERYTGTWWLMAPPDVDPALISRARKIVGALKARGANLGIGIMKQQVTLPDGAVITASVVHGNVTVSIQTQGGATTETPDASNLWVPRGFVIYPAWTDNPYGVGLPIIQAGDSGPYDPVNLAPGLDTSRWTAGGPCGEVLVSPDLRAGYQLASAVPVPLMYDTTAAPQFYWTRQGQLAYDARPPTGSWSSYRLELAPFTNQGNGANPAEQQALFEGFNAVRQAADADPAVLRLRGYARMAEVTSTLLQANGSASPTDPGFPDSYATTADRLTADGYTGDWTQQSYASFTRDDAETGSEFLAVGDAAGALSQWSGDAGMHAKMVVSGNHSLFLDAGATNGFSTAQLVRRDRWIAAGNMSWQSSDQSLPPISWHSFASINLGWETYPCTFNPGNTVQPLSILWNFTDTHGDCWLNYLRGTTLATNTCDAGMGRHIYCRGRAIAMAPEGALVWGACIIPNAAPRSDRLVLLAHHPDDQIGNPLQEGFVRYLRVWWCDITARAMRLDPTLVVVGMDTSDALAWKGGTKLDLGIMPAPSAGQPASAGPANSLKMASQWRFSSDGLKAVCLRDYGAQTDYTTLYRYRMVNDVTYFPESVPSLSPRAVELHFSPTLTDLGVSVVFHDVVSATLFNWSDLQTQAIKAPLDVVDTYPPPLHYFWYELGNVPLAVDYDTNGNLVYVLRGAIRSVQNLSDVTLPYDPTNTDIGYTYIGTGTAATLYPSQMAQRVLVGANVKTTTQNFYPGVCQIADVTSFSLTVDGAFPWLDANYDATEQPCWPYSTANVYAVKMIHQGVLVRTDWYPDLDGAIFSAAQPCGSVIEAAHVQFVDLPLAVSRMTQAYYAQRFGEWIFSYQVAPVPLAVLYVDAPPEGDLQYDYFLYPQQPVATHYMKASDSKPRGGQTKASITLPTNDWLIFSKVA